MSPSRTSVIIQEAQIELDLKNNNQMSLRAHTVFHTTQFLSPSPPSSFGVVHVIQATFEAPLPSSFPFQKNLAQRESISARQAFGSIYAEVQKLISLEITVEISWSRPAKDRARTVQDINFDLIF